MRKIIIVALVAAAFTTSVTVTAEASGFGPCSQDRFDVRPRMGHAKVERKMRALIRCATDRWNVSGGISQATRVASCESGLWPWAIGGSNYGIYQHNIYYWFDRVDRWLSPRWFNDHQWERLQTRRSGALLARANVIVGIRMAHAGGWGPWSCA